MDILLLKRLNGYFSDSNHRLFLGKPVSSTIIAEAEQKLNVTFDKSYKEFLLNFGGSYAGIPIYGFNNSSMLSSETVVDLTNKFRINYEMDDRCPLIQGSYVISIDGSGDPIMLTPKGEVIIYYHDSDETETLYSTFDDLVSDNIP